MVAHLVATKKYSEIPSYGENHETDKDYIRYLSLYFRYMNSFSVVLDSLKETQSSAYVKEAIKVLFVEGNLSYINTVDYVNIYYPVLKSELDDVDFMRPIIDREAGLLRSINEKNITKVSKEFLEDLFHGNQLDQFKEKLHTISQGIISTEEQLYSAFKTIDSNRSLVLSRMTSAGKYVHMTTGINLFANWYRTLEGAQLKTSNNARLIWSWLVEEQRCEVLKELHDVLMEVATLKERRIKVIHDFHDVISFTEPVDKTSRRAIAALFGESSGDETLRAWLNAQQFTFSAWPKAEAETVSQFINDNQEDFSDVINRSSFIKNRLPAPTEETDES